MKKPALFILMITVLILAACGADETDNSDSTADTSKIKVYTTVYPLTYFTERIGGDFVDVTSVYPAGANEHTFEPTQQDMIAIAEADLMFYIGLGLEGFIDSAKKTLEGEDVEFTALADAITDERLKEALHRDGEESHEDDHEHEDDHDESGHEEGHEGHNHGSTDPHIWMSPKLSQDLADSIKESLIAKDSANAETYEANHEALIKELQQLDQSFSELHEQVSNDTFFVSHAAFTYLAEPYGFQQVAVAGLNSQDEPSQKELTEIVELAREKNIEYIVFEQNVSSNLTEVVQKEVGAEAVEMHNLGVLTQENIDNNETYFSLMQRNLEVLETILQ